MKQLAKENNNTPEVYNKIFTERKDKGVDEFDLKRWQRLIKYYRGGRFIDLGCLDSLAPVLAQQKYPESEVWGIDTARKAIDAMKQQYPNVYFSTDSVYETHFPKNYFSYAVAGELMEHLEDPKRFLVEAFRILKSGGILAISTPLEEANEPGAVDSAHHLWSYSHVDMEELLRPYGEVWIRKMGSQYFPTYKYHFPPLLAFVKKK